MPLRDTVSADPSQTNADFSTQKDWHGTCSATGSMGHRIACGTTYRAGIARRLAVGLSMALAMACGCRHDECEIGGDHCSGNTLMRCELPCAEFGCGNEWVVTQCTHCVDPRGAGPFCALSDQPDPRCDQSTEYCDGDREAHCRLGYLIATEDCAAANRVCVQRESDALCALSSEPDPSCVASDDPVGMVCDGRTLKSCDQGYVLKATTCPAACSTPDHAEHFCALSTVPDPRCDARNGYCDGSTLVACTEGFARSRIDCTAMRAPCSEYDSGAYCDVPVDEDAGTGAT